MNILHFESDKKVKVFRAFRLLVSVLHRSHAEMIFDVFAKEGGVGKTEIGADLFDAEIRLFQIIADVLKYMFGNPFVGRLPRMLLADGREILGGEVELRSIRLDGAVLHGRCVELVEETLEMM